MRNMYDHGKKEQAMAYLRSAAHRYRHAWVLSYLAVYLVWFVYLEETVTRKFHIITLPVDLKIPFCEYFIIPYMLWFAYIACGIVYFFFKDTKDFYRLCVFLFTGMTVFLFISTVYPNGHYLRPIEFPRENWCTQIVRWLYRTDTATNLFPSIHVYNSLGVHIALVRSQHLKDRKVWRGISLLLCCSIILSTMFLKQHSVFDVLTAFGMAAVMYYFVYSQAYQKILAILHPTGNKQKKQPVVHDIRL